MFQNIVGIVGSVSCITALTMIRGRDAIGSGIKIALTFFVVGFVLYLFAKKYGE